MKYIVAIDQGTTSSRAVVFDEAARAVASHAIAFEQIYPEPGWVEHRPEDILRSSVESLRDAVSKAGIDVRDIAAVGITNQRETTLMWDRATGACVGNAIVWQCRRSAPIVERLRADGVEALIRARTGLVPDAYFSATKLMWMFENIPGARERAGRGELCFGTVDSYLTWQLTRGHRHVTDATNAGRTMLFDIRRQRWDGELLDACGIPAAILPEVVDSACVVGMMDASILGCEIPVAALCGDQHAALFGQGCTREGLCKNTYGTGCFVLMNTGERFVESKNDLVTTMAWRLDGRPIYALEGSVFIAGAALKWLKEELGILDDFSRADAMARAAGDNGGVYFVPAFTGLGAPYWDMYSRGTLVGMTRGTNRNHIVRATLEGIAYQSYDVLEAMRADAGIDISALRVDGGASRNDFLMQFQSDLLGAPVLRPAQTETTALGAAMLAGRAVGLWSDKELAGLNPIDRRFDPEMAGEARARLAKRWHRAVECARLWGRGD